MTDAELIAEIERREKLFCTVILTREEFSQASPFVNDSPALACHMRLSKQYRWRGAKRGGELIGYEFSRTDARTLIDRLMVRVAAPIAEKITR